MHFTVHCEASYAFN